MLDADEAIPDTAERSKFGHSVTLVSYGYNERESIAEFLAKASALLDTVADDYELIFVDDCSTDGTWDIAQRCAAQNSRIRTVRNERNRNIGYSFKRGVSLAEKEFIFWQTVDWSYDMEDLRIFLELLKYFPVVIGIRPVPIRAFSYVPVIRSLYRVRKRSDDLLRAMVSIANYYVLRILFGVNAHDFQNIQFHRTATLQSLTLKGESSFLGVEMMSRTLDRGMDIIEVPIRFLPRQKGQAKGIRLTAIWKSCRDIMTNWMAWGWRARFHPAPGRGKIYRLAEPVFLDEKIIALCAGLFKKFR